MRLFSGMFADLYTIKRLKQTPAAREGRGGRGGGGGRQTERVCVLYRPSLSMNNGKRTCQPRENTRIFIQCQ